MKDSVFDGVLSEFPVGARDIRIRVMWTYNDSGDTTSGATTRDYPSKAEATFKRESAKAEVEIRRLGKAIEKVEQTLADIEKRTHTRIAKLEKKNDPDTTDRTKPVRTTE